MTPQDEREAIARVIAPMAWNSADTLSDDAARLSHRRRSLEQADAILALRQPGAECRRAVEDAPREPVARTYTSDARGLFCTHCGCASWRHHYVARIGFLCDAPARLLPESTKGEGRGE